MTIARQSSMRGDSIQSLPLLACWVKMSALRLLWKKQHGLHFLPFNWKTMKCIALDIWSRQVRTMDAGGLDWW